ncbi:hypothetical protein [Burkholderia cenocepacia]|uniref:Uncharacterized protein n=1 Tax=Burkholderia cenocepacia TaxID=95486 RepID=A0ABD4UNU1_9BURK|nr:hypothetical protein [Burkholderia cenocepacia]MCW3699889.1 hypothetical protein [Burkholderia cenocepacia]MCW3707550.1 hypothetical protein [Burkholderia cenocepacia]MCW3715812.1 hypothetical protein [Burkholderia cenocepacia]MCW3723874.1 hypothetical protein [Burkholderia cenocepacia]MCW3733252.1 hypothetical protein [Burkholderia cenocepacia]
MSNHNIGCGAVDGLPPLRAELQTAHDEMNASRNYLAYAACRTHDGQAWEVNIRTGNIFSALEQRYCDRSEALAAGEAWLMDERCREPDTIELAFRQVWKDSHLSDENP